MRNNQLKRDLYWIGRFLGDDIYLQCSNEEKAEIAERLLAKILTDADLKAENIKIPNNP